MTARLYRIERRESGPGEPGCYVDFRCYRDLTVFAVVTCYPLSGLIGVETNGWLVTTRESGCVRDALDMARSEQFAHDGEQVETPINTTG